MWKNTIVHPGGREHVSRNEVVKSLKVPPAVAGRAPRIAQRVERRKATSPISMPDSLPGMQT
jgi:hypothetical protein